MAAPTRRPGTNAHGAFYRRWIAACTAGELVGIGAATAAGVALAAWIGEPQTTALRLIVLAIFTAVGAVEGGALAFLQWRVLRTRLPRLRAGEWLAPTIAVAIAGWVAGMALSLFVAHDSARPAAPGLGAIVVLAACAGAAAGLCFGAAQWFVLRRHAERASRWIWIHMPAWAVAMAAIFVGASLPDASWSPAAIAASGVTGGVLGGLLLGAVTGLVARRLTPWVDEARWSLQGQVALVTGANSALGQEIATGLARLGAAVVLLCRRAAAGEDVRQRIVTVHPDADVSVVSADLTDFASIRRAASRVLSERSRLDILVHNAGATFPTRTVTIDGVEATLAVDVVGPFLFTALLRDRLERCGARVIALTGIYHRRGQVDVADLAFIRRRYNWLAANNQAQRGRFLFTWELARRVPRLVTTSVHPGAVLTGAQARLPWLPRTIVHTVARPAFVRAEVGAIPVVRLAAHPDPDPWNGRFFDRCQVAPDAPEPALADAFWAACEALTGERRPAAEQTIAGSPPAALRDSTGSLR
jgi:NAD(P)-dependent dehydrogenase (short-subunit alcohol dehydrogenase family)